MRGQLGSWRRPAARPARAMDPLPNAPTRLREQAAMRDLLQRIGAAEDLDRAIHGFASLVDHAGADESLERIQTQAADAITEALIYIAKHHGWQAGAL